MAIILAGFVELGSCLGHQPWFTHTGVTVFMARINGHNMIIVLGGVLWLIESSSYNIVIKDNYLTLN